MNNDQPFGALAGNAAYGGGAIESTSSGVKPISKPTWTTCISIPSNIGMRHRWPAGYSRRFADWSR